MFHYLFLRILFSFCEKLCVEFKNKKKGFSFMDKIEQLKQQKQYEAYVKKKTPQHNVWFNMMKAFFLGGTICLIGQCIYHFCELKKLSPDDCSSWTSILLILLSILLTGTGIYPLLAKWGGAGALVPITGFANSVAAPAIEYKKEGQVFGIGCKIFTIAGPVILYGIVTSWALGVVYWVWTLM
jgi:stage V sporulation protein AC